MGTSCVCIDTFLQPSRSLPGTLSKLIIPSIFLGPVLQVLKYRRVYRQEGRTDLEYHRAPVRVSRGRLRPNYPFNRRGRDLYVAKAPVFMPNSFMIGLYGHVEKATADRKLICQLYSTSFSVTIEFVNGHQSVAPLSVQPLKRQTGTYRGGYHPSIDTYTSPGYLVTYFVTQLLFESFLIAEIGLPAAHAPVLSHDSAALGQSALMFCPEKAG